jgi:hypothetical protein
MILNAQQPRQVLCEAVADLLPQVYEHFFQDDGLPADAQSSSCRRRASAGSARRTRCDTRGTPRSAAPEGATIAACSRAEHGAVGLRAHVVDRWSRIRIARR